MTLWARTEMIIHAGRDSLRKQMFENRIMFEDSFDVVFWKLFVVGIKILYL